MSSTANDTRLQRIQSLQFTDRKAAETLLLAFVRDTFPDLGVAAVELRPLAVSLNSFNGFLTLADDSKLFYKTHVEPGSVINEYYNTTLLAEAGYPIVKPRYASTEYGKQFLIYNVIDSPSVFDVARAIEHGSNRDDLSSLATAQHHADDHLLKIYLGTLEQQSPESAGQAAIHQLFHHRLGARYSQFYTGKRLELPGTGLQWEELCTRRWEINGTRYAGTLGAAVTRARITLQPAQAGPSIIGHGDAHNGNVFYTPDGLVYFDPAFGGRHHPLLDLTKPLFHNVFATWLYHPQEIAATMTIRLVDDGTTLHVEHNYRPSMCREMFLTSKMLNTLLPLIHDLHHIGWLAADWRETLKAALMCCPLLTLNLADSERFPPSVSLLGLCYAVEMGMEHQGGEATLFSRTLDEIEAQA